MGNYILAMTRALRFAMMLLMGALLLVAAGPGFRSRQIDEHYAKHGHEFGDISRQEYLQRAQTLRDAPVGGVALEVVTRNGIDSRFDRSTGYFGAYNSDRTILAFFIPNAGERYFRRQALKKEGE